MSKSIRILTIHFGTNHGSALQTFALSKFLNDNGFETKVIDYIPKRYRLWNNYYNSRKREHPLWILLLYFPIFAFKSLPNRLRFEKFLKACIPLTKRYTNPNELKQNPPKADIYIVGSDQVWNDDYNGKNELSYYLDFVENGKKIAYAASFGKSFPLIEEEIEKIRPYLSKFDLVTVREKDGVDILNQADINAFHVIDPTFFLTDEEWKMFSEDHKLDVPKEKYILVYVMDGVYDNLLKNACVIKEITNYSIVVVCFTKIKDSRVDKCFCNCTPIEFVKLIRNSEFVLTNSFHGTAFSINLKKRFLTIGKERYNSRMASLLQKLGLLQRFIKFDQVVDKNDLKSILVYDDVLDMQDNLNNWIDYSKRLLLDSINDEKYVKEPLV